MKPVAFDYERPRDIAAAITLLGQGRAKLLAGGQSLGPMLNLRLAQPELLVDLAGIAELRDCASIPGAVRLGALVTHAMIEDGRVPDPTNGILPRIAAGIAYRAVRNRGTLGGSLAHADPAADWLTAMSALGAVAIVATASGDRRVPVAEFVEGAFQTVLGENEILTAIEVAEVSAAAGWGFVKFCRKTGEFADAMAAVLRDPERNVARAVIGATSGAPIVLDEVSQETVAVRFAGFDPIERRVHTTVLRRALAQAGWS